MTEGSLVRIPAWALCCIFEQRYFTSIVSVHSDVNEYVVGKCKNCPVKLLAPKWQLRLYAPQGVEKDVGKLLKDPITTVIICEPL